VQEPSVGKFFSALVVSVQCPLQLEEQCGCGEVRARSGGKWWCGCCGHTLFQKLSCSSLWHQSDGGSPCRCVELPPRMAGMATWLVMLSNTTTSGLYVVQSFMTCHRIASLAFARFHWFRTLNAWVKSSIILAVLLTTFFLYFSFINLLVTNHQWHAIGDLPALSSSTVPWQMSRHHPRTWPTGDPSFLLLIPPTLESILMVCEMAALMTVDFVHLKLSTPSRFVMCTKHDHSTLMVFVDCPWHLCFTGSPFQHYTLPLMINLPKWFIFSSWHSSSICHWYLYLSESPPVVPIICMLGPWIFLWHSV